ncbi:hypothetical protein RHSIM_Rhsim01G0288400 [Rhododendron simsii]|uniref:Uncharacterized protein n=1 Tax=Rhododendron simsii TaxID=118357 RepID=A0A834HQC0_RHOSS|nr:hypothetical protein RHSIM_Rhsim01G0288400 [Rhododendron simsii]
MADTRYFDLTTSLKQALDLHMDMEEDSEEENDDLKPEYVCPFCLDDFDLVGFCCHVDNGHPIEAKSGEEYDDPLVEESSRVVSSFDIAADPMLSSLIYNPPPADVPEIQLSNSTAEANIAEESSDKFSLGRSEREAMANIGCDELEYSSWQRSVRPCSKVEEASYMCRGVMSRRIIDPSPFSNKDQEEKARRCKFVQGLLFSTFLDDGL